ncbi:30S ribosomal protein S1 [Rubrivirga sp. S365]|uniref:30S ribosomal protein S1 n=1 Tax=Rubrivirga litoralis TaxID=3075598 RepID=A0ABU3BNY4_9BACT|nr:MULTISPECIES: 30S ribosomal protein S1 [unclassified Rubrivirga]MDT0630968.1 30S ribosomal protein S1 [Rubrivirga sp. F394]MDT7856611.1 30S ribosomal protein S1 [Rubrivirga sp. S365]
MANEPNTPETSDDASTPQADGAPEAAPDVTPPASDDGEGGGLLSTVTHAVESAVETAADAAKTVADTVADVVTDLVEGDEDAPQGGAPSGDGASGDGAMGAPVLGYTGKDLGRTISIDDLNAADAKNAGVSGIGASAKVMDRGAEPDEMETLYGSSMSAVEADQIVTGKVVGLTEKEVVVDIGFKSDGVVAKNEFGEVPEMGDEIDVYVDRLEDRRGQLTLSYAKANDKLRWNIFEGALESGAVIEGEIVKRIKGGMIVNLLGSEAFLPGSQVDVRPVRDFDVYLGKTMEFKVVKTNPGNGNVVISHKALIEKDLQEQREHILDSLEVGQVLEGQVKNIVNFGAFVDLGGVDGLLHITDISWGRVGHPSEVLELDQKLNVVVLDYDKERQRISLGYKQLQKHPWDDLAERLVEGMEIEGRVVSVTDYGAFVEVERGIEGLVHISEMSWTEHVKHPTQKVQLGQTVNVKVLKVDEDSKKISLGMKQLEPDPWEGLLERFPVGTITRGKVRNITTFGAFVEIEPGIDGLVHVSDLSWTRRVKHPSEVVKKGMDLDVIVLDIDIAQRRISLGHKQVSTDPWAKVAEVYTEGADAVGAVAEINDGGVVVDLPLDVEAFVPASHLQRSGRPMDSYQIGDELELQVIRMDREDRELVMSETAKVRSAERAERSAENRERQTQQREERRQVESYGSRQSGPATLGEISGLEALRQQMAEAEANAVSDEDTNEPPVVGGKATSQLEGTVGEANRVVEQTDETAPRGSDEVTSQRQPKGAALPSAENSEATFKSGGQPAEGSLASAVETATGQETPTTAVTTEPDFVGPNVDSVDDVDVPEVLEKPAGEVVADALGTDDAPEPDTELGGASATIEGDLDALRGEDTDEDDKA